MAIGLWILKCIKFSILFSMYYWTMSPPPTQTAPWDPDFPRWSILWGRLFPSFLKMLEEWSGYVYKNSMFAWNTLRNLSLVVASSKLEANPWPPRGTTGNWSLFEVCQANTDSVGIIIFDKNGRYVEPFNKTWLVSENASRGRLVLVYYVINFLRFLGYF